jgi:lactose/L-arabinose transport system substrate-binding protein
MSQLRSGLRGPLVALAVVMLVASACGGGGGAAPGETVATQPTATTEAPAAGTTAAAAESVTLTVWCWEGAVQALQAVDQAFAAEFPQIELDYLVQPPAEVYRNVQLAITAGSGAPDVSCVEDSHLAQFVELGALADLTDLVSPYLDQMNEYKWNQATEDGRYFAMPWDSGPVGVFYRRDVFEEVGLDPESISTWEDYYQAALQVQETTGEPMWQQAQARNDGRLFETLLWQRGLGYVDAEGNVILDQDPRIEETLEFMSRFWQEGLAADTEPWTDPWYKEQNEGLVATVPGAVWMGTFFKSFIAPDAAGQWGVFPLPVWEEGGLQASNDGGSSLAIFEQSTQKDAAWAYVEFHLGREESQLEMYRQTDIFPSLETTYEDPFFEEPDPYFADQNVRQFFAEVVQEIPEAGVYSSDYQEMNSLLTPEIQRVAIGEQTAAEALANAARAIRDRTGRS